LLETGSWHAAVEVAISQPESSPAPYERPTCAPRASVAVDTLLPNEPERGLASLGMRPPDVACRNKQFATHDQKAPLMLPAAPATTPRFRYESDMIPVISAALPTLSFGRTTVDEVELFTEVPAVFGIPDLTAIRFDFAAVTARTVAGVRPLATDAEVRLALALETHPTTLAELARRSGYSVDYVRRAVLPMLTENGWVTRGDNGDYRRAPASRWVSKRIVTVEAKLRDWSRALGQARRQRLSADAAYIALDMPAVKPIQDSLDRIAAGGIGVIGVDAASGRARVLVRPATVRSSDSRVGRMLIAERCLEMWQRGERTGQVYPVFGWTAPTEAS